MKYDDSGNQIWETTFDGPANSYDGGIALDVDNQDDVYLSAGSYGMSGLNPTLSDFSIQKYSSSGTFQWETRYDNANMMDVPAKLGWRAGNNTVYVSGAIQVTSSTWKMLSLELSDSNGNITNSYTSGSSSSNIDQVSDLTTDGTHFYVAGNVEVSGEGRNMKLVKLDDDLSEIWSVEWNGTSNQDDKANGVAVDSNGNVYMTGVTTSADGDTDYALIKLNSTGNQYWEEIWDGADGGDDRGVKLKIDGSDIISCGDTYRDGNLDMLLFMHDSSGDLVWKTFLNTDTNKDDEAVNVALQGNEIYLSGRAQNTSGNYTYVTAQYSKRDTYIPAESDDTPAYVNFQNNHGQLRSTGGGSDTLTRVYYNQRNPQFYANDDFYSLVYSDQNDSTQTLHRVDVGFRNSDRGTVYTHGEKKYFSNYFLGHLSNPVYRNFANDRAIHYDLYKGIDFIYTADQDGYKVYAVVTPAGDPTDIGLDYSGQNSLSLNAQGDLLIGTDLGTKVQTQPQAYTMNTSTGALTELGWDGSYSVQNDIVSINTGSYSPTDVLVLEWGPEQITTGQQVANIENLEWSTFFGGPGNADQVNDIASQDGSVWLCGQTQSMSYPEIPDEIVIDDYEALEDAFLAEFNENAQAIRFHFYGGNSEDYFNAVDVGRDGNVHAAGYTESNLLNQSSNGINDSQLNGVADGFYAEFDGNVIACDSYIGGYGVDLIYGLAVDNDQEADNYDVYLVGYSNDDQNFPEMANSGTNAYNQSYQDDIEGFIIQVDEDREQLWGTFFGGDGKDFVTDIAVVQSKVVIVGTTETYEYTADECDVPTDGNFPKCNLGDSYIQPSSAGLFNRNAFIASFDEEGEILYSGYFGMSIPPSVDGYRPHISGYTQSQTYLDFYMVGITSNNSALSDFPSMSFSSPGYNQAYPQGTNNQDCGYLAKFQLLVDPDASLNSLLLRGTTFFGGSGSTRAINVDAHVIESGPFSSEGRIYIGGYETINAVQPANDYCTVPTNGDFPICDDANDLYLETNIAGANHRGYIAAFTEDVELIWSTQYGEAATNGVYAVSGDQDYAYLGGFSEASTYTLLEFNPNSQDDYFQNFNAGFRDGAFARFSPPFDYIVSNINESTEEDNFSFIVYPNPSYGQYSISVESPQNGEQLVLYDISGRIVKVVSVREHITHYQLEVQSVESGIYSLSYQKIDGTVESKLIEKL
jgi:hypothetical protein